MTHTIQNWDELDYWTSEDWKNVQERLDEAGDRVNPSRDRIFLPLDLCPIHLVKVVIFGQDPYPDPDKATGLAFSIPKVDGYIPPSLENIFSEYCTDLHHKRPRHGDLTSWTKEGVLLWNVIPTNYKFRPLSHSNWEWHSLTREICKVLSLREVVFILMGQKARAYIQHIDQENGLCEVIETGHPSPLAVNNPKNRSNNFIGSRIFSRTNDLLVQHSLEPINWWLD